MNDLIRTSALLINRDDDDESQEGEETSENVGFDGSDKVEVDVDEEDAGNVDMEVESW